MPRVAIVVVTYNSAAEIAGCLDSLAGVPDAEILVVDNASSDETLVSIEEARQRCAPFSRGRIRVIANPRNAGFAGAVNQGVRATTAPFVLLLNPDAQLQGGLTGLIAQFDDPRTGAAGGMLTGPDGRPQVGFMVRNLPTPTALVFEILGVNRLWPRNRANWYYRCLGINLLTSVPVEQPAGAFLMFSRQVFERVGGFNERFYPIWFEDVDFCARLKAAGYRVYYTPQAVAKHTGGHSVGTLSVEIRKRYWYGSLLEYASIHYSPLTFRVVCFAVLLGAGTRASLDFLKGVSGGEKVARPVYRAIARLAISRMIGSRS
jgi:GT2 family glycosyltransferase